MARCTTPQPLDGLGRLSLDKPCTRIAILTAALAAASAAVPAKARTIICIPEAAAAAVDRGGELDAGRMDTSSKFLLSDEDGTWKVHLHPYGAPLFTNCTTEFFCDAGEMFAGAIMRASDDQQRMTFTAFWMSGAPLLTSPRATVRSCDLSAAAMCARTAESVRLLTLRTDGDTPPPLPVSRLRRSKPDCNHHLGCRSCAYHIGSHCRHG